MSDGAPIDIERLLAERDWLRRLALRLVHDPATAEDLTQETLLRALERGGPSRLAGRAEGDSRGRVRGWLSTVVRRVSAERYRTDAKREQREKMVAPPESGEPFDSGDELALGRAALQRDLVDALLRLQEPERSAVTLRYLEGLSYADVASRQEVTEAACRKRVSRGIAQLREQLDHREGGRGAWFAIAGSWAAPTLNSAPKAAAAAAATTPKIAAGSGWLAMKGSTKGLLASAALLLGSLGAYRLLATGEGSSPAPIEAAVEPSIEASDSQGAQLADLEPLEASVRGTVGAQVKGQEQKSRSLAAFPPRSEDDTGTLVLRVSWSDGTPAAGVTARLLPWGDRNARQRRRWVVTDEAGAANVEGLSAGRVGVYFDRGGGGGAEVRAGEVTVAERTIPLGFEVVGRVLSASGSPVAGASIVLSDYGNDGEIQVVTETDAAGFYSLRDVGEGRSLSARAAGWAPSPMVSLDGIEPGTTKELDLHLREGNGVLPGVVVDEGGVPIRGALLHLTLARLEDGSQKLHPHRFTSAEDGTFRLEDVGVGTAVLDVSTESHVSQTLAVAISPGDLPEGLAEGEHRVVMILGGSVGGTVRRVDGSPATEANVRWSPTGVYGHRGNRSTTTDSQGRFMLSGLPAGTLDLTASEKDYGKSVGQVKVALRQTAEWNPLLMAGRTVSGRVVDEGGEPLEAWMVGTQVRSGLWDRNTKTLADGTFVLKDVRKDAADLHVTSPDGWKVGSLLTRSIAGSDGDAPLEIVVPDSLRPGSSVRCRVLADGRPLTPAAVVRVGGAGHGGGDAYTGDDGEVLVERLKAGTATLTVTAEGYSEFRRVIELEVGKVHEAGVIELVRGGTIRARFRMPEEALKGGATLPGQATVYDAHGDLVTYFDLQDGAGVSEGIQPGEYEVRPGSTGRLAQVLHVTVLNEQVTEVEADIEPSAHARALVIRADGERPSPPFLYRVVDSAENEIVAPTSSYVIPMAGSDDLHLWVSSLPKGSFTLRVTDANGARGEVSFDVPKVGYGFIDRDDPNRDLRVELERAD